MQNDSPQIEQILKKALALKPEQRRRFLDEVCQNDESLRREVEALLAAEPKETNTDTPAVLDKIALILAEQRKKLQPGTGIGHYVIREKLGAGGMGEVYLAEDTQLKRAVALKVLPAEVARDRERISRFIQEARAASSLNHPNILTIYEIGQDDDIRFIASEYVRGETLRRRLQQGAFSVGESVEIFLQIAAAMDAAHQSGIIHRDIKPENIMIRDDGLVKVLDFGLAKLTDFQNLNLSDISLFQTASGVLLGTPRYMSPEQVSGSVVDARSDLFSLGVVLYECLTGQHPFSKAQIVDLMWEIKNVEPVPVSQINPRLPHDTDEIIFKLLAKNPVKRYQSVAELREDLRRLQSETESADRIQTQKIAADNKTSLFKAALTVSERIKWQWLAPVAAIAIIGAITISLLLKQTVSKPTYAASPEIFRLYRDGTASLRDGAYEKARKQLEQAVADDKDFAPARAALAEALMELDYSGKAGREILQAIQIADGQSLAPADELHVKAVSATLNNDFERAINFYLEIARLEPENPQAHWDLGRAYERNQNIDKAVESYREAIRLYPQYASAYLRLGFLYSRKLDLKNAEEAFADAEKFYEMSSNDEGKAEVFYRRGAFLNSLNERLDEAQAQLLKIVALERASDYQKIRARLELSSLSCTQGEVEKSKDYAREAVDLARRNRMDGLTAWGLTDLGVAFICASQYDEAESYLKQAIAHASEFQLRRNEARAKLQLGSLYVYQRKSAEALSLINEARDFFEKGGYRLEALQALALVGQLRRQRGDYAAALDAFKHQLEIAERLATKSQIALAHAEIGQTLTELENFPEALKHVRESYQIYEQLGDDYSLSAALTTLAESYFQLGETAEAQKYLDKSAALIKNPSDENFKELLASIYLLKARIALSKKDFEAAKNESAQAIKQAGSDLQSVSAEAKTVSALAQSSPQNAQNSEQLCRNALDEIKDAEDSFLTGKLTLNCAQVALNAGNFENAYRMSLELQKRFAAAGQIESEWRTLLIAAISARRTGKTVLAEEYTRRSAETKSKLQAQWGIEAFERYLNRPDVQSLIKEFETNFANE